MFFRKSVPPDAVHVERKFKKGPIVGDLLYGAYSANEDAHKTANHPKDIPQDQEPSRLYLHALNITFRHPVTSEPQTFTSDRLCY